MTERRVRRDVDVTEGQLTALVVIALLVLGGGLALGARLGSSVDARHAAVEAGDEPRAERSSWRLAELPAGFVGPPPPPDPPPIGGGAGLGEALGGPAWAVVVRSSGVDAMVVRQRLLADALPAYVRSWPGAPPAIRVGDYATRAEAARVAEQLRERGHDVVVIEAATTTR